MTITVSGPYQYLNPTTGTTTNWGSAYNPANGNIGAGFIRTNPWYQVASAGGALYNPTTQKGAGAIGFANSNGAMAAAGKVDLANKTASGVFGATDYCGNWVKGNASIDGNAKTADLNITNSKGGSTVAHIDSNGLDLAASNGVFVQSANVTDGTGTVVLQNGKTIELEDGKPVPPVAFAAMA